MIPIYTMGMDCSAISINESNTIFRIRSLAGDRNELRFEEFGDFLRLIKGNRSGEILRSKLELSVDGEINKIIPSGGLFGNIITAEKFIDPSTKSTIAEFNFIEFPYGLETIAQFLDLKVSGLIDRDILCSKIDLGDAYIILKSDSFQKLAPGERYRLVNEFAEDILETFSNMISEINQEYPEGLSGIGIDNELLNKILNFICGIDSIFDDNLYIENPIIHNYPNIYKLRRLNGNFIEFITGALHAFR